MGLPFEVATKKVCLMIVKKVQIKFVLGKVSLVVMIISL